MKKSLCKVLIIGSGAIKIGQAGEFDEHRQLDRARVLELVDQYEVNVAGELLAHRFEAQQFERQSELIGEVDCATLALVESVSLERLRRDVEDQADCLLEIGAQLRVPRVPARRFGDGVGPGAAERDRRPHRL